MYSLAEVIESMATADIGSPVCVGKKRSFDAAFKLKVIACAESTTNRAAAAKFFVDEKSMREWRKQKESLLTLPEKKENKWRRTKGE